MGYEFIHIHRIHRGGLRIRDVLHHNRGVLHRDAHRGVLHPIPIHGFDERELERV